MKLIKSGIIVMIILFLSCGATENKMAEDQKNAGVITYNVKQLYNPVEVDSSKRKTDEMSFTLEKRLHKQAENAKKLLSNLTYTLKFNTERAQFALADIMVSDHDTESLQTALSLSDSKNTYTLDLTKETGYKHSELGNKKYLVKQEDFDWQLEEETKEIAGFVCKKATTKVQRNEDSTIEVTAWYAPDINYNYGPKGYHGLPGLILAIEEHGYYFYPEKIDLDAKTIKIKKPKGTVVSTEEYEALMDDYYGDFD